MAEIVVILDLPMATSDSLSTTEMALLLQRVTAASIIDFVDSDDVTITPTPGSQAMLDVEQGSRYAPSEGTEPEGYWGRS